MVILTIKQPGLLAGERLTVPFYIHTDITYTYILYIAFESCKKH